MYKTVGHLVYTTILLFVAATALAQIRPVRQRCGTSEYYQQLLKYNPGFRKGWEINQQALSVNAAKSRAAKNTVALADTIPIVIHVVGSAAMQAEVTDEILQSQINILNEDFSGLNADSSKIPAHFKPLFGRSKLVFLLAKQNEFEEPATGIIRKESSITFSSATVDDAKLSSKGGSDAWNPKKFLNIWVISFGTTGLLGVSVFPGDPRPLYFHGFVCDYRAFGRGAPYLFNGFNKGRTATHELGHFFNLHHIWADDEGGCSASDFEDSPALDDTPNQAAASLGNPDPAGSGTVVTDGCSPGGSGIMYQNYMDYTDDVAMNLFTKGQHARMEAAMTISPDRASLLQSNAYAPPPLFAIDARIRTINKPEESSVQCAYVTPLVVLRNSGSAALTTVQIGYRLDNGTPGVFNWTGHLAPYTEQAIQLPGYTTAVGSHVFIAYTVLPNGLPDQNAANDSAKTAFEVLPVITLKGVVEEGFSSPSFPPPYWKVYNRENDMTWQHNTSVGRKAPGSAWVNDYNSPANHTVDDLLMPVYSYTKVDSAFLSFQLAAAIYSPPSSGVPMDTLSILLTKDCGATFTTIYKKWGAALQTISGPSTAEFFPAGIKQWRKDSVNLIPWLGLATERFQIIFRFNGNYENNLFLDDITLFTKTLPQQLKDKGYLVLPTVTPDRFSVWHYLPPTSLRTIAVYNVAGQLVWEKRYSGNAEAYIDVNLSTGARGVYMVHLQYTDKQVVERIIKQ